MLTVAAECSGTGALDTCMVLLSQAIKGCLQGAEGVGPLVVRELSFRSPPGRVACTCWSSIYMSCSCWAARILLTLPTMHPCPAMLKKITCAVHAVELSMG